MLVSDVEITQYHYDAQSSRHCANVAFELPEQTVSLFCQLEAPVTEDAKTRRKGFITEAARQLLRMPEFRSGQQQLQFAKHLMT